MPIPIPGLTLLETRFLKKLVAWSDECGNHRRKQEALGSGAYVELVTTDLCSKRMKLSHDKMLVVLNRLEAQGYLRKRRRLSAGLSRNGYDGSLYSEVIVLPKARDELERFSRL